MRDATLTELGAMLRDCAADGVCVVRVLERHGFGTVEAGQLIAVAPNGRTAGKLFRGALQSTIVDLANRATSSRRRVRLFWRDVMLLLLPVG